MNNQNYFLSTNVIGDFNSPTIDNSGYGALPAAEKNQIYFAYFTSVGSTTPEIINQTSYFIKYLIDAQGNVVAPQPNSIDTLNMVQNFEPGKLVNVTSLEGTTTFNSLLGTKRITDIGKIENLLVSQTGSGIKDFVPFLDFVSPDAIYTYSDWDYSFFAKKNNSQTLTGPTAVVSFETETLDPNNQFNTGSSNYYYTFGRSTVDTSNPVSFKVSLRVTPGLVTNANGNVMSPYTNFQIVIQTASAANPTNYSKQIAYEIYNMPSSPGGPALQNTFTLSTPFLNFESGSRVRVYASGDQYPPPGYSTYYQPGIAFGADTYFTLTPQYVSNLRAISPYFTTGSTNDIYLTCSAAINNAYYLNLIPETPTASLSPINFSNITNVFHPQPGDYIRFEYNPLKTYRIYEVIENGDDNSVAFRLNRGILNGTNINNFVIYRVNPNSGNQIILDVQKPFGTTGEPLTGFIKPQHMTKELEDNFTTIIQKLAAEGTI